MIEKLTSSLAIKNQQKNIEYSLTRNEHYKLNISTELKSNISYGKDNLITGSNNIKSIEDLHKQVYGKKDLKPNFGGENQKQPKYLSSHKLENHYSSTEKYIMNNQENQILSDSINIQKTLMPRNQASSILKDPNNNKNTSINNDYDFKGNSEIKQKDQFKEKYTKSEQLFDTNNEYYSPKNQIAISIAPKNLSEDSILPLLKKHGSLNNSAGSSPSMTTPKYNKDSIQKLQNEEFINNTNDNHNYPISNFPSSTSKINQKSMNTNSKDNGTDKDFKLDDNVVLKQYRPPSDSKNNNEVTHGQALSIPNPEYTTSPIQIQHSKAAKKPEPQKSSLTSNTSSISKSTHEKAQHKLGLLSKRSIMGHINQSHKALLSEDFNDNENDFDTDELTKHELRVLSIKELALQAELVKFNTDFAGKVNEIETKYSLDLALMHSSDIQNKEQQKNTQPVESLETQPNLFEKTAYDMDPHPINETALEESLEKLDVLLSQQKAKLKNIEKQEFQTISTELPKQSPIKPTPNIQSIHNDLHELPESYAHMAEKYENSPLIHNKVAKGKGYKSLAIKSSTNPNLRQNIKVMPLQRASLNTYGNRYKEWIYQNLGLQSNSNIAVGEAKHAGNAHKLDDMHSKSSKILPVHSNQKVSTDSQSEIKYGQAELKYGQREFKHSQDKLKYSQGELKYSQNQLRNSLDTYDNDISGISEIKDNMNMNDYDNHDADDDDSAILMTYKASQNFKKIHNTRSNPHIIHDHSNLPESNRITVNPSVNLRQLLLND